MSWNFMGFSLFSQKKWGIWDSNMEQNCGNECLFLHILFLGGMSLSVLNCCEFCFTCFTHMLHMFHCGVKCFTLICFTAASNVSLSYVSLRRHMFHCGVKCFTAFPAGVQAESEVGSMAMRLAFMSKSPNRVPWMAYKQQFYLLLVRLVPSD